MLGHFGALAGLASTTEILDIRGHLRPDIAAADLLEESIASSMGEAVDSREERTDQRRRNHGTGARGL